MGWGGGGGGVAILTGHVTATCVNFFVVYRCSETLDPQSTALVAAGDQIPDLSLAGGSTAGGGQQQT